MKIVTERPPEWIMTGCLDQFRININTTYWTYGDILYNPGGGEIPDHVIAHEEQHVKQQSWDYLKTVIKPEEITEEVEASDARDFWWKRYLTNPRFRLEQEAEAYGVQYRFFRERNKDRNKRTRFKHALAAQLSGPLYQLAVSHDQARSLIEILSGEKPLPSPIQKA